MEVQIFMAIFNLVEKEEKLPVMIMKEAPALVVLVIHLDSRALFGARQPDRARAR